MSRSISIVNDEIINGLLNEKVFKEEIIDCLNTVIDKELEKDIINDELISEAVNAINLLDKGKVYEALVLLEGGSNVEQYVPKRIKFTFKKAIAAAIAAVMVTMTLTYNVSSAFAYEVNHIVSQIFMVLNDAEDNVNEEDVDTSIEWYLSLPDNLERRDKGEYVVTSREDIPKIIENADLIEYDKDDNEIKTKLKNDEVEYKNIGSNITLAIINHKGTINIYSFTTEGEK